MERIDNLTDNQQFLFRNLQPPLEDVDHDAANVLSRNVQQVVVTLQYLLFVMLHR